MIELNMDILNDYPGAVVHCGTEDEAVHRKVSNWRGENSEWDVYKERTVYYVYWDRPGSKMLYGHTDSLVNTSCVVEFSTLICDTVDLPIRLSDMEIESLIG